MVGADVEVIFVRVTVAFDLGAEVVAGWWGDGPIGSYSSIGSRCSVGSRVDWVGRCSGEGDGGGEKGEEGGEGYESEFHWDGIEGCTSGED